MPELQGTVTLTYALLSIITVLMTVCSYFIKQVLNKVNSMWDKVISIESTLKRFDEDVSFVRSTRKDLKDDLETIVILKRDQQSIWRKIDELKEQVGH